MTNPIPCLLALGAVLISSDVEAQTLLRSIQFQSTSPNFGLGAAAIGDVNGDGHDDIVIGEPQDDTALPDAGSATVVSGATGQPLYRVFGRLTGEGLGFRVNGIGDANGDGIPDFAVSVPWRQPTNLGRVIELRSGRDGHVLREIIYPMPSALPGTETFAAAGDVNGDGFADVLVADASGRGGAGSAIVFSGRDGSALHEVLGPSFFAQTGQSLATAGDVNDDGFDDFAVSTFSELRLYSGVDGAVIRVLSFLQSGSRGLRNISNTGDLDGDGVEDHVGRSVTQPASTPGRIVALSGATGQVLWTTQRGENLTAAAGDVNGDGTPDVLVSDTSVGSGRVTLLSGLDGSELSTLTGPSITSAYGRTIGTAGDWNGDGLPEFLFQGRDTNGNGAVFVFDAGFNATPGRVRRRGAACPGSDGRLPTIRAQSAPRIGLPLAVRLRSASPMRPCALLLGLPTQIDLSPIGAAGCTSLASPILAVNSQTDQSGRAEQALPVPSSSSLIGFGFAAQWVIVDPIPGALPIATSAALDLAIGN